MSAIVCGKRSNYSLFEDLQSSPPSSSPAVSKRLRWSSSSSSPPRNLNSSPHSFSTSSALDHLVALFPDMNRQLLEKALEDCGDLDSAIKSLNELRLESGKNGSSGFGATQQAESQSFPQGTATTNIGAATIEDSSAQENEKIDTAEWVEFVVQEMMSSSNIDEAKARASRALESFEKSISVCVAAEATKSFEPETMMLKQQLEVLIQENTILKRAVSIQHERQKEFEDRGHELHHLKQLVSQYQEQLRTLELNNYALAMHLRQAQQNNSISGHSNPDVF